jgi:hypothetical protein
MPTFIHVVVDVFLLDIDFGVLVGYSSTTNQTTTYARKLNLLTPIQVTTTDLLTFCTEDIIE